MEAAKVKQMVVLLVADGRYLNHANVSSAFIAKATSFEIVE